MKKKHSGPDAKPLPPARLRKAHEVACLFYQSRLPDGSLDTQRNVAEKNSIEPPRFAEALKDAWMAGIVDVVVSPPPNAPDYTKILELEARLKEKLEPYSPIVKGSSIHKLKRIHIVPTVTDLPLKNVPSGSVGYDLFHSVRAQVCNRAAREYRKMIHEMYERYVKKRKEQHLYVGVSWGRTCEGVINLMKTPVEPLPKLVVCPLIGLIGHRNAPADANTLAYRLGAAMSGTAIKLPVPCLRPPGLELEKLRSVAKALEEIELCQIGLSGVAPVYNDPGPFKSSLVARKMVEEEQIIEIKKRGAVAEIHCHFFDINGKPLADNDVGFIPMSISIKRMQKMDRFMIVVRPDKEKILPAIVSIKAGICSDLVIDHRIAYYILDDKNNGALGL